MTFSLKTEWKGLAIPAPKIQHPEIAKPVLHSLWGNIWNRNLSKYAHYATYILFWQSTKLQQLKHMQLSLLFIAVTFWLCPAQISTKR